MQQVYKLTKLSLLILDQEDRQLYKCLKSRTRKFLIFYPDVFIVLLRDPRVKGSRGTNHLTLEKKSTVVMVSITNHTNNLVVVCYFWSIETTFNGLEIGKFN